MVSYLSAFLTVCTKDLLHCFTALVRTSLIREAGDGTFLIFEGTYKRNTGVAKAKPKNAIDKLKVKELPQLKKALVIERPSKEDGSEDHTFYTLDDERRTFESERPVHLGCYGTLGKIRKYCGFGAKERPHRVHVIDHKSDSVLQVKAYIFCGEPNDWAFHAREGHAVGKCRCTVIGLVVHTFVSSGQM